MHRVRKSTIVESRRRDSEPPPENLEVFFTTEVLCLRCDN